MEKVLYCLWRPAGEDVEQWANDVRTAAAALAVPGATVSQVNVDDGPVQPAAIRFSTFDTPIAAVVSVWFDRTAEPAGRRVVEETLRTGTDRLAGYRNALASADIPFAEELVVKGNWLPSSGYDGTRQLMALPLPPTAIFCQNDRMAVGCYEALKELSLSIPRDISVIGYDNDEISQHVSPPLTTMNIADRALGRWVIEQLFHGTADTSSHPLTKLECELVERESISPPLSL